MWDIELYFVLCFLQCRSTFELTDLRQQQEIYKRSFIETIDSDSDSSVGNLLLSECRIMIVVSG